MCSLKENVLSQPLFRIREDEKYTKVNSESSSFTLFVLSHFGGSLMFFS